MDSAALAQKILTEQHVLAYPGGPFAGDWEQGDHYLRLTFLQPEERLREGLARMKVAVDQILAAR
jgi:aspartate/methionine/tyrosine aminotransferase